MALTITTRGDIDQIVVSSLTRAFVQKIYRHCWGKNNTPYFAGNCFKGVLYFDERLAGKYAEDLGLAWKGWMAADKFLHKIGACHGSGLMLSIEAGGVVTDMPALGLAVAETRPRLAGFLSSLAEGEVLVVFGSVDKGEMVFSLPEAEGPFDPDKLTLQVSRFSDFYSEESLITGMVYDGPPHVHGERGDPGQEHARSPAGGCRRQVARHVRFRLSRDRSGVCRRAVLTRPGRTPRKEHPVPRDRVAQPRRGEIVENRTGRG